MLIANNDICPNFPDFKTKFPDILQHTTSFPDNHTED